MNYNINFSNAARLDLYEARDYYLKLSEGLLVKFDNAIFESIQRLEKNPENFQKRYQDIKIVFTKKFPYSIHYLVDNNTVFIQRILHQKQYY